MDVIGGISAAISLVLKAKALAEKTKNLEMKEVIVDLQSQLIDVKEQVNALREENITLKAEANKLSLAPEVELKDGLYYKPDGDGPFCTGCFDGQGKLMRAVELSSTFRDIGKWRCPACTTKYK